MKIEEEPEGLLIQFQGIRDLVAGQKAALSTPDTKNSHCLAVDQEYDTKHSGAFAEQEGVILRALGGDIIAICPPLVISESEVDEIFDRFARALDKAEAWVRSENLRDA